MEYGKVYQMPFAKVYPLLVNKAVKKGAQPKRLTGSSAGLPATVHRGYPKRPAPALATADFLKTHPA